MRTFNETNQMVNEFEENVAKEREKIKVKKVKLIKQRDEVNKSIEELSEQYLKADIEDHEQEMIKIDKKIKTEQDMKERLDYKIKSYENAIKDKNRHKKQALKVMKVAQKEVEEVERYRVNQRKLAEKLEAEIKEKNKELDAIKRKMDTGVITERIGNAIWRIKDYLYTYDDNSIKMIMPYTKLQMVKKYDANDQTTHRVSS